MLVVVHDGNVKRSLQLLLDLKALGRLDVLEVDTAEGRCQRANDLDKLLGVLLVDL